MRKLYLAFDIGDALKIGGGRSVKYIFTDPRTGQYSLGYVISNILPNIYIFASVILFFILVIGGLTFIINAGKDNPEEAAKGKKAATAAIIGFLIIFCSYWIIQIIKTVTGVDILSPKGFK